MIILLLIAFVFGQCLARSHPWIAEKQTDLFSFQHLELINTTRDHAKDVQMIFIGDSITERWQADGKDIWRRYYAPRHAYNYAIIAERTENLLWRIQNKHFDGLNPKVLVLMIGFKNVYDIKYHNTAEDAALGVYEVLREFRLKMPNSKIILLAGLPCFGRAGQVYLRIKQLNAILERFSDEQTVYWLDMSSAFLTADGHQNTSLYVKDLGHLSSAGYEVWQRTMEPLLNKLYPVDPNLFSQFLPWNSVAKDVKWMSKHQQLLELTQQHKSDAQLIFVGDSITEGWQWAQKSKEIWDKHYTPRHAYNYGISGDQTQQIIWRLKNNEFDELQPKVAVLMIGTNNLKENTIEEITHGVEDILAEFSLKMPGVKTILLGVLPRDEPLGTKAKQLNVLLKVLDNDSTVYWLDMWSEFEVNGQIKTELYLPDHLNLNSAGYVLWQKTMDTLLNKLYPVD